MFVDKTRVVMIDDEKDFSTLVKKNLEQRGDYEVFVASDANAGIRAAKKERPDIILLDIRMPNMDGFQTLEKLKNRRDTVHIPVIMLTAIGDDESKVKAAGLFNEDYLTKPIEIAELKSKIEQVLRRNRAVR